MENIINNIKNNFKSGLTVSLISIPLSVSLAVASNATPLIGIITAVWAGVLAAIFGGSNYNITGPTGALSGVIGTYVLLHGIEGLPTLAILVGIIVLLAYIFKLERFLILIPSSVIHGFTLGVAFIIGLNQFNSALGLSGLTLHESFIANLLESFKNIGQFSLTTFAVFCVFLGALFVIKKMTSKIPSVVVLAPIGIALGYFGSVGKLPFSLQTLGDKFGDISFKLINLPSWNFSYDLIEVSFVIALIAILETMLSAKIADGMTKTKCVERKEMLGLAIANIGVGLLGGMPATAALARTSLNIKSGADHKSSAMINSFFVAIISLFFLGYFKYIPMAVIASILVYVAIQMVDLSHFYRFIKYEKHGFYIALFVAFVTVVKDPMVGILLGVAISLLLFVNRLSHGYFDLKLNTFNKGIVDVDSGEWMKELKEDADVMLYSIKGKLCYINSRAHVTRFEHNFTKYKTIVLRLREIYFMDIDGVEALDEIIGIVEARGQKIMLTGVDIAIDRLLEESSTHYKRFKADKLIFDKTTQALEHIGIPCRDKNLEH